MAQTAHSRGPRCIGMPRGECDGPVPIPFSRRINEPSRRSHHKNWCDAVERAPVLVRQKEEKDAASLSVTIIVGPLAGSHLPVWIQCADERHSPRSLSNASFGLSAPALFSDGGTIRVFRQQPVEERSTGVSPVVRSRTNGQKPMGETPMLRRRALLQRPASHESVERRNEVCR